MGWWLLSLKRTWATNKEWRANTLRLLKGAHPEWKYYGPEWISWIWIDTGSEEIAQRCYQECMAAGEFL